MFYCYEHYMSISHIALIVNMVHKIYHKKSAMSFHLPMEDIEILCFSNIKMSFFFLRKTVVHTAGVFSPHSTNVI